MNDKPALSIVTLPPKPAREYDTSLIVSYLEELLAKAKAGELTGLALTWASAKSADTSTWWGTAEGSGHLNDLGSGIARLAFRYQNEAYSDAERIGR